MESRLVKTKCRQADRLNADTLRRWEANGELLPARKTRGGTRYTPSPICSA